MGISSVLKTLFLFLGQLHIAVSWNWIRLSRLKSEKCVGFDSAPSHLSPPTLYAPYATKHHKTAVGAIVVCVLFDFLLCLCCYFLFIVWLFGCIWLCTTLR